MLDPSEAVLTLAAGTGIIGRPSALTKLWLITIPLGRVSFPVSIIANTGNDPRVPVTWQDARFPPSLTDMGVASAKTVVLSSVDTLPRSPAKEGGSGGCRTRPDPR